MKDQLKTIRDALERLSCLGNGSHYGNSDGNRIAQEVLPLARQLESLVGEQEPVAYGMLDTQLGRQHRMMMVRLDKGQDGCTVPLYTAAPVAQQPQAEAMPSSDLNPDEGDPVILWAEIWRLREAVKGPDGYATWQDAATAERIRRVRAESKQAEASALIERMADALRSCSGVPHWPSFQPLINEASKWKVEAVPPTHVLNVALSARSGRAVILH